ncbi:MAG TPA: hypothetical protein QGF05_00795 [Dehalococcoidia bacterium]|nr:hypothetical protein [Dehalococcoidia bacterium]
MTQAMIPDATIVAAAWSAMHDANAEQETRLRGPRPDDNWAQLVPRFSVGDAPRELPTVAPRSDPATPSSMWEPAPGASPPTSPH